WRSKPALFTRTAVIARISPRLIEQPRARHESHAAMPGASTSNRRTGSIVVIAARGSGSTTIERRAGADTSTTAALLLLRLCAWHDRHGLGDDRWRRRPAFGHRRPESVVAFPANAPVQS